MKPHIFFDDQPVHLKAASEVVPSVHVPFGVLNAASSGVSASVLAPQVVVVCGDA